MKPYPLSYAELEAAVLDWATSNPDLQLALVVGSRARRKRAAIDWGMLIQRIWKDGSGSRYAASRR